VLKHGSPSRSVRATQTTSAIAKTTRSPKTFSNVLALGNKTRPNNKPPSPIMPVSARNTFLHTQPSLLLFHQRSLSSHSHPRSRLVARAHFMSWARPRQLLHQHRLRKLQLQHHRPLLCHQPPFLSRPPLPYHAQALALPTRSRTVRFKLPAQFAKPPRYSRPPSPCRKSPSLLVPLRLLAFKLARHLRKPRPLIHQLPHLARYQVLQPALAPLLSPRSRALPNHSLVLPPRLVLQVSLPSLLVLWSWLCSHRRVKLCIERARMKFYIHVFP